MVEVIIIVLVCTMEGQVMKLFQKSYYITVCANDDIPRKNHTFSSFILITVTSGKTSDF